MTHRRAVKEEAIVINRDWVNNQTYRLSHPIHVIFNFLTLGYLFELITKIRVSNNSYLNCISYVITRI